MKFQRAEKSPALLSSDTAEGQDPFRASSTAVLEQDPQPGRILRIPVRLSYVFELIALLVVGAFLQRELLGVYNAPLEPDSMGYRENVAAMKHLFDTDIREPIWIWAITLFEKVWGSNDTALRLGSMYTFLATDCLVYLLSLCATRSRLVALGAFLIFGLNPFLLYLALTGNRDNMVLLSMTGLTLFSVFREFPKSKAARVSGLTLFSVLAAGSRLSNITGMVFLFAYAVARKQIRIRDLAIPIAAVALVLVPYLLYCQKTFHDPFVASNVHSRWYRNYEFCRLKQTGCPGCDCAGYFNQQQKVVNSYNGKPVTTFHYVFGMHPPRELAEKLQLGLSTILFSEGAYFEQTSGFHYNFIWPVYFLGIACLLVSRHRVLLLVPLAGINIVFFTVNMMPGRIFTILSPFFALTIAFGAATIVALAVYLLSFPFPALASLQPFRRQTFR